MHAFVGADRHGAGHGRENVVPTRRQRLLNERDAVIGAGGELAGKGFRRPEFVGVDDEAESGAPRAPRRGALRRLPRRV